MYAGHYAAGFALKRAFPEAPLWSLFVVVQAADIAFMAFITVGIESATLHMDRVGPLILGLDFMPYSHSLLTAVLVLALAAGVGQTLGKVRLGLAIGLAFASHWLTDVLVHTPDMPIR